MTSPVEQIKEKLDIVQFIRGYVELKPAGRNLKGPCPFHTEKTPSFIVSPERRIWHCFGCGAGGDIFKFIMNYENLEFYEALKVLAEKAGIELKSLSPGDQKQFGVLYDINGAAKDFFIDNLKKSPEARRYLEERGLKNATIHEFEVGFAPDGFDKATLYLISKGYKVDDILRAGISFRTDKGKYLDRFRNRIMFPIHNHFGKVSGFSGRIMPGFEKEDVGKYINSPDTPVFNKSRILYGFWKSKKFIRDTRSVFVVEGQMDFLMSWQDGIKEAVATSGTALTPDHLRSLRIIADRVVMGFDNDEAGLMAIERGIDLMGAYDFNVLVFSMDKYKDPAEAVMQEPGFITKAISEAKLAFHHYFDRYLGDLKNIDIKKKNIRILLKKIQNLKSSIEQSNWLTELSHKTGIPESDLRREMEMLLYADTEDRGEKAPAGQKEVGRKLSRLELVIERILALVYVRRDFVEELKKYADYLPTAYRPVHESLVGDNKTSDPSIRDLVNLIILRSGLEHGRGEEAQEAEFKDLIREMQLAYFKDLQEDLRRNILISEANNEEERTARYLKEFDDISKRMQDIKKQ